MKRVQTRPLVTEQGNCSPGQEGWTGLGYADELPEVPRLNPRGFHPPERFIQPIKASSGPQEHPGRPIQALLLKEL